MSYFREFQEAYHLMLEAGVTFERQENEFVLAINNAVIENSDQPITIKTKDATIKNVIKAKKYTGRQKSGSEPYTDVQLITKSKVINLSMKGPNAPSLAGGGLRGIEEIIPGLGARFFKSAYDNHIKKGLKAGDKIPDTYGKLNDKDKKLLVIGNKSMGGPIDYIFEGATQGQYDPEQNVLSMQANLTSALALSKTQRYYINMAPPRAGSRMMFNRNDNFGMPMIFDNGGRQLSIVDRSFIPAGSKVIRI